MEPFQSILLDSVELVGLPFYGAGHVAMKATCSQDGMHVKIVGTEGIIDI
jgi:hypothetical protein